MVWAHLLFNTKESSPKGYLQKVYFFFSKLNAYDVLVLFICLASFGCSLIESIVNYDNQHWGWAYIAALDIKRGAIPHAEVIIFYGYVYTWLQSLALTLFGERLISVGIVTGLFYSLTFWLSYRIFLRFLSKKIAFLSTLLIFLIHPYIIYPASNYFAYTFQLTALICFLRYSEHRYNGFLAGFFLCLAVLSRYSSVIAILPPFIILLGWDFFKSVGEKKLIAKKIGLISFGFLFPIILFFTYLFVESALDDFFFQNQLLVNMMGSVSNVETYLNFLASIFQLVPSLASDFRGKFFTIILIVCLCVLARELVRKISGGANDTNDDHYDITAVCLIALFGYLNAIHVYETFRLVNGVSLGVGICALVFYNCFIRTVKPLKYFMAFVFVVLCLFLSSSLFFKPTTSSYYPWNRDVLFGKGMTNKKIGIFRGKLLTKEYNDFYQDVYDTIAPFKKDCHIINYTQDIIAFLINDLPRVQISPVHLPGVDDISKQAKLINEHKAVILSFRKVDFPGYMMVFAKQWPEEIPWFGGGHLFIYAPQRYINGSKLAPNDAGD